MWVTVVFRSFAFAASVLLGSISGTFAQVSEQDDPPGRVGRLSYMEGTVSYRDAEEEQWVPATINFPVTSGAAFWTEPNARAEIQIGSADLRLDQTTAVEIIQLDDTATQIAIDQGTINLRLRDLPPGGVRLITPRASVILLQPGRYHVDVDAPQANQPGETVRLAVLDGAARVDGLPAPLTVTTGHSATMREGEEHPLLAQAVALPLDTWALERERALAPQEALRYVSPEMTGYQDLDRHGQWTMDPTYGAVWYPTTATVTDWAPYRYGHWAYVRPWGWTWIDHQPWGFAPFHYGRWVRVRDRWGWCPGTRVVRPVYAPALVAFVGGSSFSVIHYGRRSPAVGWVPLGPKEIYRPYHRHSARYVRNVNITHVNVTNVNIIKRHDDKDRHGKDGHDRDGFRNHHNRDGMTVVSSAAFTGATAVDKARVRMRDDDLREARAKDSLDDLRPSRSAKAGLLVPAVASGNDVRPRAEDRRSRHMYRDDDRLAPTTQARPPATASMVPARDPDILPRSPGPDRERRATASRGNDRRQFSSGDSTTRQNRAPAASPLDRPDRAAPALRGPDASMPTAIRTPNDGNQRVTPPGRNSSTNLNRPSDPPGRQPNPFAHDGRDSVGRDNDGRNDRDRRRPDQARTEPPRSVAPSVAPRPLTPDQTPGRAPNTVAPTRPTPITPPPSANDNRPRPDNTPGARSNTPPRDMQRNNPPQNRPERSERNREEQRRPSSQGGGASISPRQDAPVARTPRPDSPSPSRMAREREAAERSSRPATMQRIEPQHQIRQEARQEPRLDSQRQSRPEMSRPARQEPRLEQRREVRQQEPRREAQPSRPQSQEATRPSSGRSRSDDSSSRRSRPTDSPSQRGG